MSNLDQYCSSNLRLQVLRLVQHVAGKAYPAAHTWLLQVKLVLLAIRSTTSPITLYMAYISSLPVVTLNAAVDFVTMPMRLRLVEEGMLASYPYRPCRPSYEVCSRKSQAAAASNDDLSG